MSDWIPSQSGLRAHPKTRRVAKALAVPVPHVVGLLHCLWWWALEYAPDGDLEDFEPEDIADAAGWEGDPEAFVSALLAAGTKDKPGFLVRADCGRLLIHDWEENQGSLFRVRVQAAARKRAQRARERDDQETELNDVTSERDTVTPNSDLARAKDRQDRQDKTKPPSSGEPDQAAGVFAYWKRALGHPDAKFGPERRRKIQARLREGYTPEQLMAAVNGCRASPHHMGVNDTGTIYDSVELIFRNGEKVEYFMARDGGAQDDSVAHARRVRSELGDEAARALVSEAEWQEVIRG